MAMTQAMQCGNDNDPNVMSNQNHINENDINGNIEMTMA